MANNQGIITEIFSQDERGKALGFLGTSVALGSLVGPGLGGIIVGAASWEYVFLINVPIGIVALFYSIRLLPKDKIIVKGKLDSIGAILLMFTIVPLFGALDEGLNVGFTDPMILLGFVVAIISFIAFILIEKKKEDLLLELKIFGNEIFSLSIFCVFTTFIAIFCNIIMLPFYLQDVMNYTPQHTGLILMVYPLLLTVAAPLSGILSDRFGSEILTFIGLILISVKGLLKIYSYINSGIGGRVGIKLHTGEPNGPNLLPIELIKGLQAEIPNSNIVECNVLYQSPRYETKSHREVIKTNGFDFCPVDIMDEEGDVMLPVLGMKEFLSKGTGFVQGNHLSEVAVGSHMSNYESMLVYTHFKGHAMGGFGGSLKNIGIGMASGHNGKRMVHGDGWATASAFLERMVESGKAMTDYFKDRMIYINVLKNMSVDCDCDVHGALPKCEDIGILASTDILAIDKASLDLVYKLPIEQNHDIIKRIESRSGLHQIEYMKTLGMGNSDYNLIQID